MDFKEKENAISLKWLPPRRPEYRRASGWGKQPLRYSVRAVFQQGHRNLALEEMPPLLLPAKGRYGLVDYEKIFCPDLKGGQDIFDLRGIDRQSGAIVFVRPDQFVASIMPLQAQESLTAFFDAFMV